jgi:ferredoxin--NADP+ reductase
MYTIQKKVELNPTVTLMEVQAPLVAKKAEPGQFIILRVDEDGERIPLTIADYDREKGTITIIFQIVGATTAKLNQLKEGEAIHDFVGPLGVPTLRRGYKKLPSSAVVLDVPSPIRWRKNFMNWEPLFIQSLDFEQKTW